MDQYKQMVEHVLAEGVPCQDRTGTGVLSVFGHQTSFDLTKGFPLLTTKMVNFGSVVRELLWMIKGSTNIRDLHPCKIWDPWAREDGDLGPVYGHQWRHWKDSEGKEHDQLAWVLREIKQNPYSRRLVISAWNVGDLEKMALHPCHAMFQFHVRTPGVEGSFLDCQLYQRSADLALGVPFNIASYVLLTMMIANECGLKPGKFVHTFGNLHIYNNHVDGLQMQIKRKTHPLSSVLLPPGKPVVELKYEDVKLVDYRSHPFIKFDVSV